METLSQLLTPEQLDALMAAYSAVADTGISILDFFQTQFTIVTEDIYM